jgi:16S rRNA (cytosine967-C5)-methyltransferase
MRPRPNWRSGPPRRPPKARAAAPPPPRIDPAVLAAEIISAANREHPADAVLRSHLRTHRGLDPSTARAIANHVFNYFRWLRWLPESGDLRARLIETELLQKRFNSDPKSFSDDEIVRLSVPEWLHEQMEVSPAWARSLQSEPVLWLRAKYKEAERIIDELPDVAALPQLPTALRYYGSEDLFRSGLFHAGAFELQDLSSQIVSHTCAPKPGETWWDACAGEGGKMLHLSDLMQNKGLIWASDRAAWRLQQLKRRTARAGVFNYRAVPWNGTAKLPTKTRFDGVLVDAPCAGVGTWQRNPHARWATTPKDVAELSQLQLELLRNVAPSIKPGGRLIYSVCTLTPAETTEVVAHFNGSTSGFRQVPTAQPLTGQTNLETWIWPQEYQSNGMFICAWERLN